MQKLILLICSFLFVTNTATTLANATTTTKGEFSYEKTEMVWHDEEKSKHLKNPFSLWLSREHKLFSMAHHEVSQQ